MKRILLFLLLAVGMTSQSIGATFSMATKWSTNTSTDGGVTVSFNNYTTETGYIKIVKGSTVTIASDNTVRRITINYTAPEFVPKQTATLTVNNAESVEFKPQATATTTTWWGASKSVVITNDVANGGDLRIASIVVTTNSDMQIYKVEQAAANPSSAIHAAKTVQNPTSVGITYGTSYANNSTDKLTDPSARKMKAMGYEWQTTSQADPNVTIGSGNIIPRTGAYYVLEPTENGELTLYMTHFHHTSIYVLEDGKMYQKYSAPHTMANIRTWYTFQVRAGYTYHLYSVENGLESGWMSPLFGFEFIPAKAANKQYTVKVNEEIYNHKTVRSADGITMTYGGWLSETDARQSDIIRNNASAYPNNTDTWIAGKKFSDVADAVYGTLFPNYTQCQESNPTNETRISYDTNREFYMVPSRGTYYKFEPKKNGQLLVATYQNENVPVFFLDENGTPQAADEADLNRNYSGKLTVGADKSYTATVKGAYGYKFNVYAGRTYFLFAKGSKLGFRGFKFEPDGTSPAALDIRFGDATPKFSDYANVTFTRTLTKNRWNSLVLPFSMNEAQVRQTFGEGTAIMQFDDVADNTIKFKRHYYQYIIAGQPIFIFPTDNWDAAADSSNHDQVTVFTMKGVSVKNSNAGLREYKSRTTTGYTMKGLYEASTTVPATSYWLVANNTIGRRTNTYTVNGNFMAYIQGPAVTAGAKKLGFGFSNYEDEEASTPTGIQDVQAAQNLKTTYGVYNLQGLQVRADSKDLGRLPAGIYIVNGKKIIVK